MKTNKDYRFKDNPKEKELHDKFIELYGKDKSNNKTLDYDMYFFIDNNAEFETDNGFEYGDALVHAYCKDKKGNYFDATGLITLNDIENEHADFVNEPEHIFVSEQMFYNYIQKGFISTFNTSELNKLETYIKENISKYTVQ